MVADTLCAQWCGPRLEPWGAAGRQLSSGPVGRQMWERSPTTIRTLSGPAEQESSSKWTLWLSWIGLPSAQLNAPTDDDSWVEVKIKWQTKQDCLMWKEVGLFAWQRVSIFKGRANLERSWLPVSAVTSALNSSQEEPGDHQTARCWCCQTPVVGQFEASWEEMLSLLSAGHHGQAVCVGVERKTFKEIDNCYPIFLK